MNLIKIYGKLKYKKAEKSYERKDDFSACYSYSNRELSVYVDKLDRLIEIVEYKLGLITQDEMSTELFNEELDKNNWLLYAFTDEYRKNEKSVHYYRMCINCSKKWYSLHSRSERDYILCGSCYE